MITAASASVARATGSIPPAPAARAPRRSHRSSAGMRPSLHLAGRISSQITLRSRASSSGDIVVSVVWGFASWGNHRGQFRRRQILELRISAVKNFQIIGGENSFTRSPSTPSRKTRFARYAASRGTGTAGRGTASARFTTGLMAGRTRRSTSISRSWRTCCGSRILQTSATAQVRLPSARNHGGAA